MAVPKDEELVAFLTVMEQTKAEIFFLKWYDKSLKDFSDKSFPDFPVTIYYAFKQSEKSKKW